MTRGPRISVGVGKAGFRLDSFVWFVMKMKIL